MKQLSIFICTVTSLSANFDVQTSWLRSSLVDAGGVVVEPDVENQSITGDPASVYNETYEKVILRDDFGSLNYALLDYQIATVSGPQGLVGSYSFEADVSALSSVINSTGATTGFNFTSSTEFTTNTSFALDAAIVDAGAMNDYSLWVDDQLLWSLSTGLSADPTPDFSSSGNPIVAFYDVDSDFEMRLLASSSDLGVMALEVHFGDSEPDHKFEVRIDWDGVENSNSILDYSLGINPNLEFTIVPESSQIGIPLLALLFAFSGRRRKPSGVRSIRW